MRSLLRVALALMMALSVVGAALVAPQQTAEADAPVSGSYVMMPVIQNGDGVTTLIAFQNTNAFTQRALVTFFPSGKTFLTGSVPAKASYLLPQSAIPDGTSSGIIETLAVLNIWTAVSPDFANLPIFWPPNIAISTFDNNGGGQQFIPGVGDLAIAIPAGTINANDLCGNANFLAFVSQYFPQLPCRNSVPNNNQNSGFIWSYVIDVTNNAYVYVTSAATGAVVGYFLSSSAGVKLSDFLGVPGFDLLGPGFAVVVHRMDSTGPRVSEYEGIPFHKATYSSTVPPGITPTGTSSVANAYTPNLNALGQNTGLGTGFIGQFGFNVYAPLVMKNYHGWNTRVWFMNFNRNNQMVITYYDQAGNPVFEETGYGLGTGRTTLVTGAGLPDGFVGTAWIATARYNAVVVDEWRDAPPMMMTYRAEPARYAAALATVFTISGNFNNFQSTVPSGTIANWAGTSASAVAPLVMSKYHGYNTGIAVLNPNPYEVRVILNFRRENGGEQYVVSDRLPARGMTPFYDAAVSNLPENFVGNVQVVAEYSPGVPAGVVAVVNTVNYVRGFADAYNLIDSAFDVSAENDLPFITKGFQGWNSGVAIMNLNPNPGRATGNFDVFTATGILERTVWQADSLATATVYMPNMYQVPNGFVGGAAAYIVQTNQAPYSVYGFTSPTFVTGGPTTITGNGQVTVGGFQSQGLVQPTAPNFPNAAAGTAIAAVVNNVNYNGVGDQFAQYGGVPVGGVFNGAGLNTGAGGIIGLVKRCDIGVGIPGLPVFVFNANIVPAGVPPLTWLANAIPPLVASSCAQASAVLPFNPAQQSVFNATGTLSGFSAQNTNVTGSTLIQGTISSYIPATPAQVGNLQITLQNGQVASFVIPIGTPVSNFSLGGVGPNPIGQSITVGLAGTFLLTLANGQAVALSNGASATAGSTGLSSIPGTSSLPGGFTGALGRGSFVTFTDANGQYNLQGLPPGEYYLQVGGFSPACAPIGTGNVAGSPSQDQSLSYVAFRNSEVDKVVINLNDTVTNDVFCLTPVGPIYEVGQVFSGSAVLNGALICAETICPSFNGVFPSGLGAPSFLGGPTVATGQFSSNAFQAYGILPAGATALPAATNLLSLPFCTVSGAGINTPASLGIVGLTAPALSTGFGSPSLTVVNTVISVVNGVQVSVTITPQYTFTTGSPAQPIAGIISSTAGTANSNTTIGANLTGGPTIQPNTGGYILPLPWFGNWKKTVVTGGGARQVYIATDCSAINITNLTVN